MSRIPKKFIRLPWLKIPAWIIFIVLVLLAVFAAGRDVLLPEGIKTNGWSILLSKSYIKDLLISPLWVAVGFLLSKSTELENAKYRRREHELFGHIKGKESVTVKDIREIMQDAYDQEKELESLQEDKRKITAGAEGLGDDSLHV